MRIRWAEKLAGGGLAEPIYTVYTPTPYASTATQPVETTAKSKSSSDDLSEKDLLDLIEKLDALPSDTAPIISEVKRFFRLEDTSVMSNSTRAIRMAGIVGMIKNANFSKKEYDEARDQAEKSGGIYELAINERGEFLCYNDEGGFDFVSVDELRDDAEGDGKFRPMTNSELLYYRAHDTGLSGNNRMLSTVSSSIGIEAVTKMITDIVTKLGEQQTKEGGYISVKAGQIIKGYEDFQKAVEECVKNGGTFTPTTQDLYKYSYLSKDQLSNSQAAMAYIYNSLPANARALLAYKSGAMSEEGGQLMMQTLVASMTSTSNELTLDLVGGVSKQAGSGGGTQTEKDETKLQNNMLLALQNGTSGITAQVKLTPELADNQNALTTNGMVYNSVYDINGNLIKGDQTAYDLLQDTGVLQMAILDDVQFGDKTLGGNGLDTADALKGILVTDAKMIRVHLPQKEDGTVDFDVIEKFTAAENALIAENIDTSTEEGRQRYFQRRAELFAENELDYLLKSNGEYNEERFGTYILLHGITTDKLAGVEKSSFIEEIGPKTADTKSIVRRIEEAVGNSDNSTGKVRIDRRNRLAPADMFSSWIDHVYEGVVYIPIDTNKNIAANATKQGLDWDTESDLYEQESQDFIKSVSQGSTDSSVLGNTEQ